MVFEGVLGALALLLALGGLARVIPALLRGPDQGDFLTYYRAAHALNARQSLYVPSEPSEGNGESSGASQNRTSQSHNYGRTTLKYTAR